jgi:hypothetical protein
LIPGDELVRVGVIVSHLEKAHAVALGLASVLKIVRAHEIAGDRCASETGPMLAETTIDELTAFGQVAAAMLAEDVERTAEWIEHYARVPGDASRRVGYPKDYLGGEHE